jgi:hypothetical protein
MARWQQPNDGIAHALEDEALVDVMFVALLFTCTKSSMVGTKVA